MLLHPLTNFERRAYYQNEFKLNGVFSQNNLPAIREGTNVITLDEFKSIETHSIALYVNGKNATYFDSFWIEYITKEIKKFTRNKNNIKNIYKIQACGSIICGDIYIGFIKFMLKGKTLLDY